MASMGRSLEQTSTWAVAAVCFLLVAISISLESMIHLLGTWLKRRDKIALFEALQIIKSELMLMGFISLLLTVLQAPISDICVSPSLAATWHPCDKGLDETYSNDKCSKKGQVALMSTDAIHQLHIFIFVLAVFQVLYCISTFVLGRAKMRKWKSWENQTKSAEYQFMNDPARIRLARETTFGRRHLKAWSRFPIMLWTVCFFRQFFTSVAKVDYLTLRHGFIMAHFAPGSEITFDFRKYIRRSLEQDFKAVVGISSVMWFFALLFLLGYTHGLYSYYWMPFIPLVIILVVGTKLQVIITKMGLRIQERGNVIQGTPLVQPGDDLFWFNQPRIMLFLIHFVMFQNAFQIAFLAFTWYKYGMLSCFHKTRQDVIIRTSMGIMTQIICSYFTLPLYALVTQMGSKMRPTVFSPRVAKALRAWHQEARKRVTSMEKAAPSFSSMPSTISVHSNNENNGDSVHRFPRSPFSQENDGFHRVDIYHLNGDHSDQQPAAQLHTSEQESGV